MTPASILTSGADAASTSFPKPSHCVRLTSSTHHKSVSTPLNMRCDRPTVTIAKSGMFQ